ncbi:hypothetical protein JAAARDRAFT_47356 [Jaapia argillacea MUCL 33604]|uniref:Uncharacterized protein n=1 Tax=Jaapia argillacea MUCL 33604 TaxID=933084 RepID=A0A067Q424_9AGAM|nr:hypothetical protein JAAARDRAFT_47356 [Jaapia argillacea MUCL 33604]
MTLLPEILRMKAEASKPRMFEDQKPRILRMIQREEKRIAEKDTTHFPRQKAVWRRWASDTSLRMEAGRGRAEPKLNKTSVRAKKREKDVNSGGKFMGLEEEVGELGNDVVGEGSAEEEGESQGVTSVGDEFKGDMRVSGRWKKVDREVREAKFDGTGKEGSEFQGENTVNARLSNPSFDQKSPYPVFDDSSVKDWSLPYLRWTKGITVMRLLEITAEEIV